MKNGRIFKIYCNILAIYLYLTYDASKEVKNMKESELVKKAQKGDSDAFANFTICIKTDCINTHITGFQMQTMPKMRLWTVF